ncbi:hypothetical protein CEXT_451231 [Caerostris extrusa]|uniref:Uncharacterized protein n=1 Tax=Caerostris extrusa TaxID=172846 RepID=A0AAV4QIN0_CAEEX|nr:hypothetical protein CEXT_451231 [Caerostris extrusa]
MASSSTCQAIIGFLERRGSEQTRCELNFPAAPTTGQRRKLRNLSLQCLIQTPWRVMHANRAFLDSSDLDRSVHPNPCIKVFW